MLLYLLFPQSHMFPIDICLIKAVCTKVLGVRLALKGGETGVRALPFAVGYPSLAACPDEIFTSATCHLVQVRLERAKIGTYCKFPSDPRPFYLNT